jgi:hypothetical protein
VVVRVGVTSLQRFAGLAQVPDLLSKIRGSRRVHVAFEASGTVHRRCRKCAAFPWRSRSRSWGLPCSLPGLGRRRLTFEGFRGLRARRRSEEHRRVGLRGLRSRSELLYRPGQSESDLPLLGFVSVDSALASFAYRRVPLHRHGVRSPLPRGLAAPLRQRGCHPPRMFRPRGLSPPRRLPPPVVSRACCIPLPILGFIAFPAGVDSAHRGPKAPPRLARRFPRDVRFVPLEG